MNPFFAIFLDQSAARLLAGQPDELRKLIRGWKRLMSQVIHPDVNRGISLETVQAINEGFTDLERADDPLLMQLLEEYLSFSMVDRMALTRLRREKQIESESVARQIAGLREQLSGLQSQVALAQDRESARAQKTIEAHRQEVLQVALRVLGSAIGLPLLPTEKTVFTPSDLPEMPNQIFASPIMIRHWHPNVVRLEREKRAGQAVDIDSIPIGDRTWVKDTWVNLFWINHEGNLIVRRVDESFALQSATLEKEARAAITGKAITAFRGHNRKTWGGSNHGRVIGSISKNWLDYHLLKANSGKDISTEELFALVQEGLSLNIGLGGHGNENRYIVALSVKEPGRLFRVGCFKYVFRSPIVAAAKGD